MRGRHHFLVLAVLALGACKASAKPVVTAELRAALQSRAGGYPLLDVTLYGRDSALLVLEDSTYTSAAVDAGTWMFGPPVTAAEAGSCPAEKVLGQRLARILWWGLGADSTLQQVVVRVKGTKGIDQFSQTSMFYYVPQLRDPWVGDSLANR